VFIHGMMMSAGFPIQARSQEHRSGRIGQLDGSGGPGGQIIRMNDVGRRAGWQGGLL
jgi:hypothetical protein